VGRASWAGGQVFAQVLDGGGAGMRRMLGERWRSQAKRYLHGRGVEFGGDGGERGGLERGEAAEREEGDVGMPSAASSWMSASSWRCTRL